MSVKHIEKYYKDIAAQKNEMENLLRELSEKSDKEIVRPEVIENVKKMTEPIVNSYEMMKWIMYLLYEPNNKKKKMKYEKQNSKKKNSLKKEFSPDAVMEENSSAIDGIKKQI